MQFFEAQRAGKLPPDSKTLYPATSWKKEAYTDICSDWLSSLSSSDASSVDLQQFPGYFEAGNAVLTTGPAAYAAVNMGFAGMHFMAQLQSNKGGAALDDSAGCLEGSAKSSSLKAVYLRQMKYMCESLSNALVVTRQDGSKFAMLVGVADSSTYGGEGPPSWLTPPEDQEKCYVADKEHPAADIAAQAAAGLAVCAKLFKREGAGVATWRKKALRAYAYATEMQGKLGDASSCSATSARTNCVGSGCTTTEDDGDPVRTTCDLYPNYKAPDQQLFVAAAALWDLTGKSQYRADADKWYGSASSLDFSNWNNVAAQGVAIMANAKDLSGAARSRASYQQAMRDRYVAPWSECSVDGSSRGYCQRSDDGYAFPLDISWGNMGASVNGMCLAALYHKFNFDSASSSARRRAACFMHRQLGYTFNHKCSSSSNSCSTGASEGFSYMVGVGKHYPTKLHSRDAAYPNFRKDDKDDGNLLCGALVSGPNDGNSDGRVNSASDSYSNSRRVWRQSEPAIDYSSSLACALLGYASLPESSLSACSSVRSVFSGR